MNNTLLERNVLELYDYVKLKNLILDIFKLFKYLRRSNYNVPLPKITQDYRVRYEQFIPVSHSALENFVLKDMMLETRLENKRKQLLSKITIALRTLNKDELKVFDLVFYKNTDEEEIMSIINYGLRKVREIRKSACIKFICALGLDYKCFKD